MFCNIALIHTLATKYNAMGYIDTFGSCYAHALTLSFKKQSIFKTCRGVCFTCRHPSVGCWHLRGRYVAGPLVRNTRRRNLRQRQKLVKRRQEVQEVWPPLQKGLWQVSQKEGRCLEKGCAVSGQKAACQPTASLVCQCCEPSWSWTSSLKGFFQETWQASQEI